MSKLSSILVQVVIYVLNDLFMVFFNHIMISYKLENVRLTLHVHVYARYYEHKSICIQKLRGSIKRVT